ncbi:NAD(P)H-binding protein [candidate division KSB1 bacterium]|nr:NAD(P)H-binding protein [candidate division KSB1 bacterium]
MTTLIVGASGATGRLLVEQLLDRQQQVKVIVRSPVKLSTTVKKHPNLVIIHANVLDLGDTEMRDYVKGCDAVASCLGHNLTFQGVFGKPRRLVTDATRRLCSAIRANQPASPVKYVLMNTTGNRNRNIHESVSFGEKIAMGLLRLLIPPQGDNEKAADYLRLQNGRNDETIEWVAVRPDTLINEDEVTDYSLHPSPTRSALFNPGQTSRINVAHFMADLISDDDIWTKWKGQMPVIYNEPVD